MAGVGGGAAAETRADAEKEFLELRRGAKAQGREIRNQAGVPKQNRNSEVGGNRKPVPHQRAAEIWPDAVIGRYRRHEPRQPDTADMDPGENCRANDREKRHRFCRTIDRGAPLLMQQKQDRRNQSARMPDTDPKNEVGDAPGPPDRDVISPGADAGGNLIAETKHTEHRARSGDREANPPPAWRRLLHDPRDSLRQPTEAAPVQNQRHTLDATRRS